MPNGRCCVSWAEFETRIAPGRREPISLRHIARLPPPDERLRPACLSQRNVMGHNGPIKGQSDAAREEFMSGKGYDVSEAWAKRAHVDDAGYRAMYARSVNDPEGFWGEQGKRIDWIKPFARV